MEKKPKVGLLPLYLELYDDYLPKVRGQLENFHGTIADELQKRGLDVLRVPVCRLSREFESAVKNIEDSGAVCIVTLHLAYSPSLESAQAIASTELPVIVLDTTPAFDFSPSQSPSAIMLNHGIHGVQDMCNLLVRNGKRFGIEVGHWEKSDVLDRTASFCRAASTAANLRTARIGLIGEPFRGMGDFLVSREILKSAIGVETVKCDMSRLRALVPDADDPAVESEMAEDRSRYALREVSDEAHRSSTRAGIAVRRWMEAERLTGFTVNFLSIDGASGVTTVPLMEASKAMSRGEGYAGEGDALTAALVSALISVYPQTTFTEMFCPDWKNGSVFLSHMGELNLNLVDGQVVLIEKGFPWTDAGNPVAATGRFRGGDAVLVNLAPGPNDTFSLIVASGSMLGMTGDDSMQGTVCGWFHPSMPLEEFLAEYSKAGGTHHSALVYGAEASDFRKFGEIMGWNVVPLNGGC